MTFDDADDESTDTEGALLEVPQALWLTFEHDVAVLLTALDPAAVVTHDASLQGGISSTPRQVDVLVEAVIAGSTITIAVECKRYARKLGIGKIDEFAGKLSDLGVAHGVLYAFSGFTSAARARAENAVQPRIELRDLKPSGSPLSPWPEVLPDFTGLGDCPNDNCYTGDIGWRDWTSTSLGLFQAGSCDTCGTWAVRCGQCGEESGFFTNDVTCWGCSRTYRLVYDHKATDVEAVTVDSDESL